MDGKVRLGQSPQNVAMLDWLRPMDLIAKTALELVLGVGIRQGNSVHSLTRFICIHF